MRCDEMLSERGLRNIMISIEEDTANLSYECVFETENSCGDTTEIIFPGPAFSVSFSR